MSKVIKIRKGLDIKLAGEAEKVTISHENIDTVSISPADFHGLIPKAVVNVGDEVKAGSPLFFDKKNPEIQFCSPVSGEVVEVARGEKRKLLYIKILADKEISYINHGAQNLESMSAESIIELMCKSGVWPMIRQRPFDIVANPKVKPTGIVITAFDSSPLAPDNDFIVHGCGNEFQAGLNALAKLTNGKVHLNVHATKTRSEVFLKAKNVQINYFEGPHPSGNVGIQIHHISPINKGETYWVLGAQEVLTIGRLFTDGKFNAARIYALTGNEVLKRRYVKSIIGSPVSSILANNHTTERPLRIISGNVLVGKQIEMNGYMGFYHSQITVIPEGYEREFFGWIAPGFSKFSLNHSFFSWMTPSRQFKLDTNLHGEQRAFVVTGEYEKVFPMNIYPVYLLKSILANDIEQMENLGIYEVAPEDFALCEFVCTSKINSQEIVRSGLDTVMAEMM